MLAPGAHEKDLELISFIYNDVPEQIIADQQRLKQILTNLINNAIKFTHSGSVVTRIMLDDHSNDSDQIILKATVTDTGTGIAPDQQKDLFSAFTQATSQCQRHGSGLGLAISKRLTEEMKGTIG
ncbi:ATP-binding protein, partial [Sinorhizobium meliloti]